MSCAHTTAKENPGMYSLCPDCGDPVENSSTNGGGVSLETSGCKHRVTPAWLKAAAKENPGMYSLCPHCGDPVAGDGFDGVRGWKAQQ